MTTFNTGATASANTASSVAITIPVGVLTGDVMLMCLTVFNEVSSAPTIAFSGAGGSWTLVPVTTGTNPENANNGTLYAYGFAYYRVATAGDPGASLTITETGSPAGTTWITVAIASYTGANTSSPIDVAGGANANASIVTCPGETTGVAGDWAVYMGGGGANTSGVVMPGPSGATQRENLVSSAGIGAAIFDSNGSVGGSGTSIGGTASFTFQTTDHPNTGELNAFTIGLAPAASAAPQQFPQQQRFKKRQTPQRPTPSAVVTTPIPAPQELTVIPRRRLARATWRGVTGPAYAAVPAPVQQPGAVPPRRHLARASWRGSAPFLEYVAVPAPPQQPQPAPRRKLSRALWRGGSGVAYVAVAAPQQQPVPAPRRKIARAVVEFTPVATTNAVTAFTSPTEPWPTVPVPRRRRVRAVVEFTPVATTNSTAAPPAGTVQPQATVPVPRRRPARASTRSATGQAYAFVPAPRQQPEPAPRRHPARAYVRFTPVKTTNGAPVVVASGRPTGEYDGKTWWKKRWILGL